MELSAHDDYLGMGKGISEVIEIAVTARVGGASTDRSRSSTAKEAAVVWQVGKKFAG